MEKLREFSITDIIGDSCYIYGDDYEVDNRGTLSIIKGGYKVASFICDNWISIIEVWEEEPEED